MTHTNINLTHSSLKDPISLSSTPPAEKESVSSSPSLSSSHSVSPIGSESSKCSVSQQVELYQEAHSYTTQYSEENKILRQELSKYRNTVEQLKRELHEKNSVPDIDIRGLVQKTLHSALLEKERYKREADKERHKREELELQLVQLQNQEEQKDQVAQEKNDLVKALQSQLIEAVQDIDHLQQLNEDTMSLLRHLYLEIPDFFLPSGEQRGEEEPIDCQTAKFTLDKFCYKVENLISESHQMVDKILELQTKNEDLVNQLEISDVCDDQGELTESEAVNERSLSPSTTGSNFENNSEENWFGNSNGSRILTESPFSLEDEEVRNHLGLSCRHEDLSASRRNYSYRDSDVELVMENLHQTQEELSKIQENLIELEENGIMLQLELEEITHQRDRLIIELRAKDEELENIKIQSAETSGREVNIVHCECCEEVNFSEKFYKKHSNTECTSDVEDSSLKPTYSKGVTEEHHQKSVLIQDLRLAFSRAQYENSRITQMIQQKSLEFLRELDHISVHHQKPYQYCKVPYATDPKTHTIWSDAHFDSASITTSKQRVVPDTRPNITTLCSASGASPEFSYKDSYKYDEERKAVREEMETIIKSLESLRLE